MNGLRRVCCCCCRPKTKHVECQTIPLATPLLTTDATATHSFTSTRPELAERNVNTLFSDNSNAAKPAASVHSANNNSIQQSNLLIRTNSVQKPPASTSTSMFNTATASEATQTELSDLRTTNNKDDFRQPTATTSVILRTLPTPTTLEKQQLPPVICIDPATGLPIDDTWIVEAETNTTWLQDAEVEPPTSIAGLEYVSKLFENYQKIKKSVGKPSISFDGGELSRTKVFTVEEVAQHNTPASAWLVIDGSVYDVTQFLQYHPGGDYFLMEKAGKPDCSSAYHDVKHSKLACGLLLDYYIGVLKNDAKEPVKDPVKDPAKVPTSHQASTSSSHQGSSSHQNAHHSSGGGGRRARGGASGHAKPRRKSFVHTKPRGGGH